MASDESLRAALEREIASLTEELTLTNLDTSLLKLFDVLKAHCSKEGFEQLTDPKEDPEAGERLLREEFPAVAQLLAEVHRTLLLASASDRIGPSAPQIGVKTALILVGGMATRLRPVTYVVPKPLLPIHGMTLTDHVIRIVARYGIRKIVLALGYKGGVVREYFSSCPDPRLDIEYTQEMTPMGTAGPLYLMNPPSEPFMMINGDNLFALDIAQMYDAFVEGNALAVVALTPVDNPMRGGAVKLEGNRITSFCEKLSHEDARRMIGEPPYWLNSGYYILSPEVYSFLPTRKAVTMMETNVFPALARTGRLLGFRSTAQWHDSGTTARYEEVVESWKEV